MRTLVYEIGRIRVYRLWSDAHGYCWRVVARVRQIKSKKMIEVKRRSFWSEKLAIRCADHENKIEELNKSLPRNVRVKATEPPRQVEVAAVGNINLDLFKSSDRRKVDI